MLRIEVIVHNTKELRGGRSLEYFPKIVTRLRDILERFLNMLYCIDACFIGENLLDTLPSPTVVGATRVGGINYNQARTRNVIEAVVALATSPAGFSSSELAAQVRALSGQVGIRIQCTPSRLRHQETPWKSHAPEGRQLPPVRSGS